MKEVTAAIITEKERILIGQRAVGDDLAGKWEFPGGKIEKGETPEECLIREIYEEFHINIEIICYYGESVYQYDRGEIKLLAYRAKWINGQMSPTVHSQIRWVYPHELVEYDFLPADLPFVHRLIKENPSVN